VLRDLTEDRFHTEKEIEPKSFKDLIKEVHEKGICGECGGCVSFCSAAEIGAIDISTSGLPYYSNEDNWKFTN